MKWETVIGLETHVELTTQSKLFCGCANAFGGEANSRCCPVCLGLPGTLPVLNQAAVEGALRAGLALGCEITPAQRFDRKNYFYPDLPKAFQISQLYLPLGRNGALALPTGKVVGIHEMHLEEDAGKLIHLDGTTRIDYNRCGVPLIEIVTEPDLSSGEEAVAYLTELKQMLEYLGVSDCRMEEGSLRCDVNVSVRPAGSKGLGTRTEMKNLSSFRAVTRAIAFESGRQIALLESGGTVRQETRRWDEEKNESVAMRAKESAADYRYFPEPNLPPLVISQSWLERLRGEQPELPGAKRQRYRSEFGLSDYDAAILTSERELAEYYERGIALGAPAKELANWMMGEVLRFRKETGGLTLSVEHLVRLIALVAEGRVNRGTAATVLAAVFASDGDPEAYIRQHGLERVSDESAILRAVEQVMQENPEAVAEVRSGKEKAFDFLMGRAMRMLRGKADPALVRRLLRERL